MVQKPSIPRPTFCLGQMAQRPLAPLEGATPLSYSWDIFYPSETTRGQGDSDCWALGGQERALGAMGCWLEPDRPPAARFWGSWPPPPVPACGVFPAITWPSQGTGIGPGV